MIINKNSKMKMEKRGEDLEVWYTHCLAHHSPGAPNTDYLAYPVVSQEAITCNNTPVALQMGNIYVYVYMCIYVYVYIPSYIYYTHPPHCSRRILFLHNRYT